MSDFIIYFDKEDPDNQTCKNCARPWYSSCRILIKLNYKKVPIHCGTAFGFIRKVKINDSQSS